MRIYEPEFNQPILREKQNGERGKDTQSNGQSYGGSDQILGWRKCAGL